MLPPVVKISMAVYTPVSAQELADFLSLYDVGTLVTHEGIEQGVSNTNYFVSTDRALFVLTLFEPHRVNAEDIPFFLHYAVALAREGVPSPLTMMQKDGKYFSSLNDRPAALFSVITGEGGNISMLTPALCEKAGEVFAQMHLAAGQIKEHARNHFGLIRWKDWVSSLGRDMDQIAPGLYDLAVAEFSHVEMRWPSSLPSGAIHGDFFPDNVFFEDGNVTGVIDFHFVCTDLFAYDLAIALNAWCFDADNNFHEDRMLSFLRGYNAVRPLSDNELAYLPLLARAASLRFLLSRIEEKLRWREGDFMIPHDPMVFAARLKHFQTYRFPAL